MFHPERVPLQLIVSRKHVGLIIGKDGRNIKLLEQRTKVNVNKGLYDPKKPEVVFTMTNTKGSKMKLALEMILDFIAEKPSYTSESCTDLDYSRNTTTGKHTNPTDHKHGSPLISPAIVDPPGLIPKQTFLSLNQNKEHVIQPVKEQDQKSGNQSKIGSAYQPETESASQSRVSSANRSVNQSYEEQAQFFAESVQEAEEQFHTLPITDAEEGESSILDMYPVTEERLETTTVAAEDTKGAMKAAEERFFADQVPNNEESNSDVASPTISVRSDATYTMSPSIFSPLEAPNLLNPSVDCFHPKRPQYSPDYNSEYQMYNNNCQQYPGDDNNQQFHGDNNNPQYPGEYSEEDFYQNNMEEVYDVNEQQIYTRPSFSADTSPSSDTGPSFSADTSLSSSNGCSADIFQYPVGAGDPSGAVGTKAREYTPEGTGGAGKGSQQRPWAEYFVPPSKRKRKQNLFAALDNNSESAIINMFRQNEVDSPGPLVLSKTNDRYKQNNQDVEGRGDAQPTRNQQGAEPKNVPRDAIVSNRTSPRNHRTLPSIPEESGEKAYVGYRPLNDSYQEAVHNRTSSLDRWDRTFSSDHGYKSDETRPSSWTDSDNVFSAEKNRGFGYPDAYMSEGEQQLMAAVEQQHMCVGEQQHMSTVEQQHISAMEQNLRFQRRRASELDYEEKAPREPLSPDLFAVNKLLIQGMYELLSFIGYKETKTKEIIDKFIKHKARNN